MPISVVCSGCNTRLNAPDAAAGKTVKCPKCKAAVLIPEPLLLELDEGNEAPPPKKPARGADRPRPRPDDDDDRPRRRRPADDDDDRPRRAGKQRPAKSGAPVALLVGLAVAAVALAGGGFAVYWFGFREAEQVAGPPAAPRRPDGDPAPDPGRTPAPPAPVRPTPAPGAGGVYPKKSFAVAETAVLNLSLSPDGGTVGLAGVGQKKDGGEEHLSVFYNLATGKKTGVPIPLYGPGMIAAGGKTTAYFGTSGVLVRDIATGEDTAASDVSAGLGHLAFAPDGALLVTATGSKLAFRPWPPADAGVREVAAGSPVKGLSRLFLGGTRVAAVQYDEKDVVVRVWDVKAGRPVDEIPLNRPPASFGREPIDVAEDGKAMVVRSEKGVGTVWDMSAKRPMRWADEKKLISFYPAPGGRVWYKDTQIKITGTVVTTTRSIVVADLQTGVEVHRLLFPPGADGTFGVYAAASADGKRFVAACSDERKVYVWDVPN